MGLEQLVDEEGAALLVDERGGVQLRIRLTELREALDRLLKRHKSQLLGLFKNMNFFLPRHGLRKTAAQHSKDAYRFTKNNPFYLV